MVDAEHGLKQVVVHAGKEPVEHGVVQRRAVVGPSERVAISFAADQLQLRAVAVSQHGLHAHLGVGVNEVVGRADGDAVEQVADGPKRRALAGLVGAVNQVQPLPALRQVEHGTGKRTEGPERELE